MAYEYSQVNRLTTPHKYQFSPSGKDFFAEYQQDRSMFISKFDSGENSTPTKEETCHTTTFLYDLLEKISSDYLSVYEDLTRFCKKYEVWKKIYTSYDNDYRRASEDYSDPLPYALLALCFLRYSEQSLHLPFVNCALKINDMLCSIEGNVTSPETRKLCLESLNMEQEIITRLMHTKNIAL